MSWIDDEINLINRQKALCQHAGALCDALWHEIEERALEARGKSFRNLIVDGESIILPQAKGEPKTLTVRVGRDGCSVESDNGKRFPLGYNGDSSSLTRSSSDNTPISIEQAAREILQPFLFGK